MDLPGGRDFTDVTQLFIDASEGEEAPKFCTHITGLTECIEMGSDELLMVPGFTLQEAMAAVGVMTLALRTYPRAKTSFRSETLAWTAERPCQRLSGYQT